MKILNKKRIVVAGSAANPPTLAHREFVATLASLGMFDRIIWVPTGERKDKPDLAGSAHRAKMTALTFPDEWIRSLPTKVVIDLRDIHRENTPTIRLLEEVAEEHNAAEVIFATGVDVLTPRKELGGKCEAEFWVEGERLLREHTFVVLPRDGYPDPVLLKREKKMPTHFMTPLPEGTRTQFVSSTEVRRRVKEGRSIDGLVEPSVAAYISANGLYRQTLARK